MATLWLDSANPQLFADAINKIEQLLAADPHRHGHIVAPDLLEIEVYPVVVAFGVNDADQIVRIVNVLELGPLP